MLILIIFEHLMSISHNITIRSINLVLHENNLIESENILQ